MHVRSHGLRHASTALVVLACAPLWAQELSLAEAQRLALQHNTKLASARLASEVASHAVRTARSLPAPDITLAPPLVGRVGSDAELEVTQDLQLNGARAARVRVAGHEARAAGLDAQASERDLLLQVRQAYWALAAAQERLRLRREDTDRLAELHRAVRRQVEVGSAPGSQVLKSEVEMARARQAQARADLEMADAGAALNLLLHRAPDAAVRAVDPLPATASAPASAFVRPELAAAEARVLAGRSQEALRVAELRPDVAVQARMETLRGVGGAAALIRLPLLDWGAARSDGLRLRTLTRLQEKERDGVRARTEAEATAARRATDAAAASAALYRDEIIPRAEQLAALAHKGYERGATGFLEVLEAQRTLQAVRTEYEDALADLARANAQLTWASGAPMAADEKTEKSR
ncbi:MAG: TolC family protein [Armatimonadetes bacterium]|nr:TolC family protein [Armatimonadota bacterium]